MVLCLISRQHNTELVQLCTYLEIANIVRPKYQEAGYNCIYLSPKSLGMSGVLPEVIVLIKIRKGAGVLPSVVVELRDRDGLQSSLVLVLDGAIDFRHVPVHVANIPVHCAKP